MLGTLRDQLLYPTWAHPEEGADSNCSGSSNNALPSSGAGANSSSGQLAGVAAAAAEAGTLARPLPTDAQLVAALQEVRIRALTGAEQGPAADAAATLTPPALVGVLLQVALGPLVDRVGANMDAAADWASVLSLGEQQRLAFARVLLAQPALVLMDESTR